MAKKASASEKKVRQIRRKSRKQYSGEEKIRIVLNDLRGEERPTRAASWLSRLCDLLRPF